MIFQIAYATLIEQDITKGVPVYGFYKACYMISKMTKAMQTSELIPILTKLQETNKTEISIEFSLHPSGIPVMLNHRICHKQTSKEMLINTVIDISYTYTHK